jgi:hypothetical protein
MPNISRSASALVFKRLSVIIPRDFSFLLFVIRVVEWARTWDALSQDQETNLPSILVSPRRLDKGGAAIRWSSVLTQYVSI